MTTKATSIVVVAMTLGTTIGCAHSIDTTITPLGAERTFPVTSNGIPIPLYATAKPECPFDEIAVITVEGPYSDEEMLDSLRSRARSLGAHAIVGYTQGIHGGWRVRTGTAIHFSSDDCKK